MIIINKPSLVLITTLFAAAGVAYGTQPPDVVSSDSSGNTAMGGDALFELTSGTNNTAAGSNVLLGDTTGSNNSAFGSQAMVFNTTGVNNSAFGYQALLENSTGG